MQVALLPALAVLFFQSESLMHYTTQGEVRGPCGHRHRTAAGAFSCLSDDREGCKMQGGYTDRHVYRVTLDAAGAVKMERLPEEQEHA